MDGWMDRNSHLHVGALMNPHLYSHTLIGNGDKAPPPNTHMHSAQPFSRNLCCHHMSRD